MEMLRAIVIIAGFSVAGGCTSMRTPGSTMGPCVVSHIHELMPTHANGVSLRVPKGVTGPVYDSDDLYQSRPTWNGHGLRVHFVFGNGGLTRFMDDARCCALDDEQMRRKVCIGDYIRHVAMADISRVDTPSVVTSMSVSIEQGGLSETEALSIVSTATTHWEAR